MNNKPWRFPEVTDWTKSNIRTLEFMHTKAQQSYEYSVDVANRITSRAFTFISILIPIISVTFGLVSNQIIDGTSTTWITGILLVTTIFLTWALWRFISLIMPRAFMHDGREPKEICNPEMIQDDRFTEEQQFISLLRDELTALQHKITSNKEQNRKRMYTLKKLILALSYWAISIISFFLIYFASTLV